MIKIIIKIKKSPWPCGRVQDLRSRGPQFKSQCGQKENLSQVQSEQYHHQSLCTRVKYLKLSEVKTRRHCGTGLEIQRSPVQIPMWAKRKSLTGPIRTILPLIPLHQS